MFEGVFPALITPFQRNQGKNLDLDGLRSNIAHLVASGVHGVVPCGSTGEAATLAVAEHEQVVEVAIDEVNGKVPVLAGTGSNNTSEALRFTRAAKDAGADGVLVISPYYNKPNRSGLVKHYTAIADLDIPPGVLILLIGRGEEFVVPRGQTRIEPYDTLLMIGDPAALREAGDAILSPRPRVRQREPMDDPLAMLPQTTDEKFLSKQVVVIGFGHIGRRICDKLEPRGVPFVIIDRDREIVQKLRDRLSLIHI